MAVDHGLEQDEEARGLVNELRILLGSHDVKPPSLGRDYGSPPLITLGNCNLAAARALVAALRRVQARSSSQFGRQGLPLLPAGSIIVTTSW